MGVSLARVKGRGVKSRCSCRRCQGGDRYNRCGGVNRCKKGASLAGVKV